MKRKEFMKYSGLMALAVSCQASIVANENSYSGNCETSSDILGPFYRPDAPFRQNLVYSGLEGNRIKILGNVYSDCETPVQNAIVEIWHCNTQGEYDNSSDEFNQRGRWKTDHDGNYAFTTIFPGKYLNGKQYRPAHIHFRVKAKEHAELISQIYFAGDEHIENDPWASSKKASSRILQIQPLGTEGLFNVEFNIHLQKLSGSNK